MPLIKRIVTKNTQPGKGTFRSEATFYVHPRKVEPADIIVVPHGRTLLDLQLQHPEEFGAAGGPYVGPRTLAELRATLPEEPRRVKPSIAPPSSPGTETEKKLSAGEPTVLEGLPEGYVAFQFPGHFYELFRGEAFIPSGQGEGRFRGKANVVQASLDHFEMSRAED